MCIKDFLPGEALFRALDASCALAGVMHMVSYSTAEWSRRQPEQTCHALYYTFKSCVLTRPHVHTYVHPCVRDFMCVCTHTYVCTWANVSLSGEYHFPLGGSINLLEGPTEHTLLKLLLSIFGHSINFLLGPKEHTPLKLLLSIFVIS